jgi:glucose/arabinose dehydrogenase
MSLRLAALVAALAAQAAVPAIDLVTVATGLRHPWSMAFLPGGDFLVTEKDGGFVRVTGTGTLVPLAGAPADLDNVRQLAGDNSGLFDVVLHPRFADTRRLYFAYAAKGADGATTRLATARLVDDRLVETTTLFEATPRSTVRHHYGGGLLIGRDGFLYLTIGERFFHERDNPALPAAQDPGDRRGKIYRFTLEGAPAPGNPDFGPQAVPALYATGVRAAQGLAQDPESGRIWMTDHGPVGGDELNVLEAGANYGWPIATAGRYRNADYTPGRTLPGATYRAPAWAFTDRTVAPAGLVVYTGTDFPEWRGDLIVAGLSRGYLLRADVEGGRIVGVHDLMNEPRVRLRNVKQGPEGALYALTDERDGRLLRVRRRPGA